MDELAALAEQRAWSPVSGTKFVDRTRRSGTDADAGKDNGPVVVVTNQDSHISHDYHTTHTTTTAVAADVDLVEREIQRRRPRPAPIVPAGTVRAINTTGPWAGGSLAAQLRIGTAAQIEREAWLKHGAAGASRPSDVEVKAQQQHRQNGGPAAVKGDVLWTLGAWGVL